MSQLLKHASPAPVYGLVIRLLIVSIRLTWTGACWLGLQLPFNSHFKISNRNRITFRYILVKHI